MLAVRDRVDRNEIHAFRIRAIHAEGVDLSAVSLRSRIVSAHAVDTKQDAAVPKHAGLALDPCERAILIVDKQVVTQADESGRSSLFPWRMSAAAIWNSAMSPRKVVFFMVPFQARDDNC